MAQHGETRHWTGCHIFIILTFAPSCGVVCSRSPYHFQVRYCINQVCPLPLLPLSSNISGLTARSMFLHSTASTPHHIPRLLISCIISAKMSSVRPGFAKSLIQIICSPINPSSMPGRTPIAMLAYSFQHFAPSSQSHNVAASNLCVYKSLAWPKD